MEEVFGLLAKYSAILATKTFVKCMQVNLKKIYYKMKCQKLLSKKIDR